MTGYLPRGTPAVQLVRGSLTSAAEPHHLRGELSAGGAHDGGGSASSRRQAWAPGRRQDAAGAAASRPAGWRGVLIPGRGPAPRRSAPWRSCRDWSGAR
ncbi:hypothetical protein QJS66_17105 [Kocuria rhizophila]|nr:hypothetical protein QJS66_17105 [Kocuria rhizophila]